MLTLLLIPVRFNLSAYEAWICVYFLRQWEIPKCNFPIATFIFPFGLLPELPSNYHESVITRALSWTVSKLNERKSND